MNATSTSALLHIPLPVAITLSKSLDELGITDIATCSSALLLQAASPLGFTINKAVVHYLDTRTQQEQQQQHAAKKSTTLPHLNIIQTKTTFTHGTTRKAVRAIAIGCSPNHQPVFISGGHDGMIALYEYNHNTVRHIHEIPDQDPFTCAVTTTSSCECRLTAFGNAHGGVFILDMNTLTLLHHIPIIPSSTSALCFHHNSTQLITGHWNGTITLVETMTRTVILRNTTNHTAAIRCLSQCPTSLLVAAGSGDTTVTIFHPTDLIPLYRIHAEQKGWNHGIVWLTQHTLILGTSTKAIEVWRQQPHDGPWAVAQTHLFPHPISGLSLSLDKAFLAIGFIQGGIHFVSPDAIHTPTPTTFLDTLTPYAIMFSPCSKHFMWNTENGEIGMMEYA